MTFTVQNIGYDWAEKSEKSPDPIPEALLQP